MIKFIKHRNFNQKKIKSFNVLKGTEILKICFSKDDVHVSRSGVSHLDIWGNKLRELKKLLGR